MLWRRLDICSSTGMREVLEHQVGYFHNVFSTSIFLSLHFFLIISTGGGNKVWNLKALFYKPSNLPSIYKKNIKE